MDSTEIPCATPGAVAEVWFATDPETQAYAVKLCRTCPVQEGCLREALTLEDGNRASMRFGVWGGKTPAERAKIRRPATRKGA